MKVNNSEFRLWSINSREKVLRPALHVFRFMKLHNGLDRMLLQATVIDDIDFLYFFPICTLELHGGLVADPRDYREGVVVLRMMNCRTRRIWGKEYTAMRHDMVSIISLWAEVEGVIEFYPERMRELNK